MSEREGTESKKSFLAGSFHTWIQTIAIILAGAWAAYTFIYKEVLVPKAAPINLALNLQPQRVSQDLGRAKADHLIPVELKIVANNPSTRTVYLLPSLWLAYGVTYSEKDDLTIGQKVEATLAPAAATAMFSYAERHAETKSRMLIAGGRALRDVSLKPGEAVTRTMVFYVPANRYRMLTISLYVPTVSKKDSMDIVWRHNAVAGNFVPTVYLIDAAGTRVPIVSKDGKYANEEDELQEFAVYADLAL